MQGKKVTKKNSHNFVILSTSRIVQEKIRFKIYNQLGMLVFSGHSETNKQLVDVSSLANGVYFIEINSSKTEKMLKLVKAD